jgi:hypothetical protein
MRRADRASVTSFWAVKVACKKQAIVRKAWPTAFKEIPHPKKVQNTGPTTTATKATKFF